MFPSQFANIFFTDETFVTNLHPLKVELRCMLQEKLHRVTGPLLLRIFPDSSIDWKPEKFPTECYFMCFQCHHLSVMPCLQQYSRTWRALREMTKMIEELEGREAEWKDTPMAARNKLLLKKWKEKIKVTTVLKNMKKQHDCVRIDK